jgi:hypothetical protein
MTVTYQAGRRIQGTSTDFGTAGAGIPAVAGGWKEVGRTTLGSAGTTITVSGLADKRYYKILTSSKGSGSPDYTARINSDTGSTYASRWMDNGSGENTGVSRTSMLYDSVGGGFNHKFNIGYIANLASKEKLSINHSADSDTSAASTAPSRSETVHKWANTSDALSAFSLISTVNMDIGSEVVVLGWDEDDTHSTNFWEELASVNASGSSTNLSSGTITAKKYLWIQCYSEGTGGDILTTFNNDTGSNSNRRYSIDGGADGSDVNETSMANMHNAGLAGDDAFSNWFIINNSANEKLVIGHSVQNGAAGAATVPLRVEFIHKWANTSAQITEIDFDSQSGNFGSDSIIKVWGSD